MARTEPRGRARIKRGEAAGLALMAAAALAYWAAYTVLTATHTDASGRGVVFHFFGLSRDLICSGILLLSLAGGAVGAVLLARGLIGRIRKTWVRETVGWTSVAAGLLAALVPAAIGYVVVLAMGLAGDQIRFEADDGRSVVVTQDGFGGDRVGIYTEHGRFHYVWNREADELSGFPRIKDRDCELKADRDALLLTCGTETVTIDP